MLNTNPTPKTKKQTRKNIVLVRLSDSELDHLKKSAQGRTAPFLRNLIMGVEVVQRKKDLPKIDPVLLQKIAGISNNLNQLTRYAHTQTKKNESLDLLHFAIAIEKMADEIAQLRQQFSIE